MKPRPLVLFVVGLFATIGAPFAQQKPTFRTSVALVVVDVNVTDAGGRFVGTLTKDDFTILEDGKPQQVATFELKDIPVRNAQTAATAVGATYSLPDVRDNSSQVTGRAYLIVLDDVHTAADDAVYTRRAAAQFIEQHIEPGDIAGVVLTSARRTASQELTSDKRLLLGAVSKFMGSVPVAGSGEDPSNLPAYRGRVTLDTLTAIASELGRIANRRKACVYFGPGFSMLEQGAGSKYATEAQKFADTANRANVSFYTVDPKGLASLAELATAQAPGSARDDNIGAALAKLDAAQEGLRWLAIETGGFAATMTNNLEPLYARIQQENSSYYLLGYYPTSEQRGGASHRIDVKVQRPGLTVHARRGYVVPTNPLATAASVIKAKNVPEVLLGALDNPLPNAGIHLSVVGAAFAASAATPAQASVVLELDGRDLDLGGHGGLDVAVIVVNHLNQILSNDVRHVDLALDEAVRFRMRSEGLRIHTRVALPPGAGTLRLAVADSTSPRVGSLWLDLDVPDEKAPISMSGVLVTTDRARAVPTVNENADMMRDLPSVPTTRRRFDPAETLAWAAEIYVKDKAARPSATLTTTIASRDGREVFRRSAAPPGDGVWRVVERAPLASCQPGVYVLRLEARAGGTTTAREVPFDVIGAAAARVVPIGLRAEAKPARIAFESYFTLLDMYAKGNADLAAAGMAKLDRSALPDPAAVRTMSPGELRIAVVLHLEELLGGAPSETYASILRVALGRIREADPDFARNATIVFVSVLTLDEYAPLADLLGGPRTTAHPEILLLRGSVAERPVAAELNLWTSGGSDQSDFARAELADAEWDYHAALEGDPHLVEARVRLGRVLLLERKWSDARRELTGARAEATEPCLQYLANLFLGQVEEGERHFTAAIDAYRSALARYPGAQAASLGLAHALEMSGNAAAAWAQARAIAVKTEPAPDPWRMYPYAQYWQIDQRLAELRKAVGR